MLTFLNAHIPALKHWLLPLFVLGVLSAATLRTADPKVLTLQPEKLAFSPKEFYIAEIIDERSDKKAVAFLLPTGASSAAAKPQPIDLQGGGIAALRSFISQSMPPNKALRPITVRVKEMRITEAASAGGRVTGSIAVVMGFEMKREGENVPLLQYKGGGKYERPAGSNEVSGPALQRSIVDALRYLNTWMDREANSNPRLAKGIKVTFTDYAGSDKADTVFYAPTRPLRWEDFQASPTRASRFSAAVFPSFAYEGESEVKDAIIHLNLNMKVFVVKSGSWVKPEAKDPYGLNHEQRHFEIAKLVAERFKQKIKQADLSVADYNSNIQYHFIESFREMNQLQDQYDGETRHGIDKAAQERWNLRLDKELKAIGIK